MQAPEQLTVPSSCHAHPHPRSPRWLHPAPAIYRCAPRRVAHLTCRSLAAGLCIYCLLQAMRWWSGCRWAAAGCACPGGRCGQGKGATLRSGHVGWSMLLLARARSALAAAATGASATTHPPLFGLYAGGAGWAAAACSRGQMHVPPVLASHVVGGASRPRRHPSCSCGPYPSCWCRRWTRSMRTSWAAALTGWPWSLTATTSPPLHRWALGSWNLEVGGWESAGWQGKRGRGGGGYLAPSGR